MKYSIGQLNGMCQDEFTRVIGPVFEHSHWIAQRAWSKRPFANLEALHSSLCETVRQATRDEQLKLIRAHPDLVGRAALAGALTSSSTREQASAGLDRLTGDELTLFQNYNSAYQDRFGFPFIICARLNKKEAILEGFATRLKNSREEELITALEEIEKIAWFRLQDLSI